MDPNSAQSLPSDIWKVVAGFLGETHVLRTVYDVARDLAHLQLVCKNSSRCADSAWPAIAKKCHPAHVKKASQRWLSVDQVAEYLHERGVRVASFRVLEEALQLPTDQLVVFLQCQADKYASIRHTNAATQYGLTSIDLANVPPTGTYKKGCSYAVQAVIVLANNKWGGVEGLQMHQREQRKRQEAAWRSDWAMNAKRMRMQMQGEEEFWYDWEGNERNASWVKQGASYEKEWLYKYTDYAKREDEARHHAEFSRYEWDRPEPKEHDDDSDYDSVCEEDGFSNPDWEKELDEYLTDAKREAMAMWCEANIDNLRAVQNVPDDLLQYIPSEMKTAYHAYMAKPFEEVWADAARRRALGWAQQ